MRKLFTEKDADVVVAIYVRVSTMEQATEGYSLGEQTARIEKYCDAMEWKVYKVYTDAGYSGGNTERPALKQMMKDVKSGKINKVVVYKLDRLSRSQKDTLHLIEDVFLKNECDFVSMNENFDTSTSFGRAMIGILAVFAQLEREQIKERMTLGKDARAKLGKFHGSNKVPIGYNYFDGELIKNEYEMIQIQRAFQLTLEGQSPYQIAIELNECGYTHKYGDWNDVNVRRILNQKTYCGYIYHKGEWFKGTHDSYISEETFKEVQKILKERSRRHQECNHRSGLATSYLGGFLHCAHCKGKFGKAYRDWKKKDGSVTRSSKYTCNSRSKRNKHLIKDPNCKNKIWIMEDLDQIIFDEIKKLSFDPAYFDQIKESKVQDDSIIILQKEIIKLDNQMSNLMDLYSLGNLPMDVLQNKITDLNEKKEALEAEIDKINEEEQKKLSKADTLFIVQSFDDTLKHGDLDDIRAVIGGLIEKIEVDNDDVTIHWKFA